VVKAGAYAYAALSRSVVDQNGALLVYDLDARAPGQSGLVPHTRIDLQGRIGGIARQGDVLFVGGSGGTFLFDISEPATPARVGSIVLARGDNGVRVGDDQLLVFSGDDLTIYDIRDPRAPVQTHASNSNCRAGDIRARRFVMGQFSPSRFLLYDVATSGEFDNYAPATTGTGGTILHARIVDQSLYVVLEYFTESASKLVHYDLSTLDTQGTVAVVDTLDFDHTSRGFAANETTVMVAGGRTVHILDRSVDGALSRNRELEERDLSFQDGFPFYGDIDGDVLLVPGQAVGFLVFR
jgi:hypothetical protein